MGEVTNQTQPETRESRMRQLMEKIKPVLHFEPFGNFDDGGLYYLRVSNPFVVLSQRQERAEKAVGLKKTDTITTYHKYGHARWFAPTVGEVLRQIPEKYLDETVAFEILTGTDMTSGHAVRVQLYSRH